MMRGSRARRVRRSRFCWRGMDVVKCGFLERWEDGWCFHGAGPVAGRWVFLLRFLWLRVAI